MGKPHDLAFSTLRCSVMFDSAVLPFPPPISLWTRRWSVKRRPNYGSPYTVIGTTDGGARPDMQIMSLEDAVYRLTGKTALMHELHDRGFIAPG